MNDKFPDNKPIYVTRPSLPGLDEFLPFVEKIWDNKVLTNNGPFHQQLENELADFLDVPYISLFANGTLALITALQALNISGEVITTPYSFVATTHSVWWNNARPVFVDIDPVTCNISPKKIEAAITPDTTAILPVHVYGNPCQVEHIQEIASRHQLKVVYDAAHTFGIKYKGGSLLRYGDLSILSFHATKVFNTMEGGAIVSHDIQTKQKIDYLKNFGFAGETEIKLPGINSKMNEMQAALGLVQLKHYHKNVNKRKAITEKYKDELGKVEGISFLILQSGVQDYNYAYFPIFVDQNSYGKSRNDLYYHLKKWNIHGRRYFYPLISSFPSYSGLPSAQPKNLPAAQTIADQVICLPLYPDLALSDVVRIADIITNFR